MKIITIVLFIVFSLNSIAQTKTKTSVKINTIDNSVLYLNGNTIIGTVILTQLPNPHLTLNPPQQTQDSTGYTTVFTFNNPTHQTFNDLDIILKFDKPVISANVAMGISYYVMMGYNSDYTQYEYKAQKVESQTIIQITIKSKKPVITSISGLDFAFNQ